MLHYNYTYGFASLVVPIERYHQPHLRTILAIGVTSPPTSRFLNEMAKVTSNEDMLLKIQFRWAGHVSRMEDHLLPKIMLYGELAIGHRDRGVLLKRHKYTLKRPLATCNIDGRQWATQTTNLINWRPLHLIPHKGLT
jgi:hypothetical protein